MPFYPPVNQDQMQAIRPLSLSDRFPSIAPRTPEEEATLGAIGDAESNGGSNLNHPVIQDPNSIHAGQAAVGKYGMMPNTLDDVMKRAQINNQMSTSLLPLKGLPPDQLADAVKQSPDLQEEFATRHLRNMPEDSTPDEKNYMWQFGNNADKSKMSIKMNPSRAAKFGDSFRSRMGSSGSSSSGSSSGF